MYELLKISENNVFCLTFVLTLSMIHTSFWDFLDMFLFYSMRSTFLLLISFNFMDCGWSYMHVTLLGRDCMKIGLVSCMLLGRDWKWCVACFGWLDFIFIISDLSGCDRLMQGHMIILFYLKWQALLIMINRFWSWALYLRFPHPLLWPHLHVSLGFSSFLFCSCTLICHLASFYFFYFIFLFWFYFNISNAPKILQKYMIIF